MKEGKNEKEKNEASFPAMFLQGLVVKMYTIYKTA